jgi:hypothetical protein
MYQIEEGNMADVVIKEHLRSDGVSIYTIISVFLKDYKETEGMLFQFIKGFACLFVQMVLPVIILYDTLYQSYHIDDIPFCPDTGTWTDRVVSSLLTFYLLFYYLNNLSPYVYRVFDYFDFGYKEVRHIHRLSSMIDLLNEKQIDNYLSKGMFTLGIIAKILCLCLTTIANIIVLFQTSGSINISITFMAFSYIYEISENIADDELKQRAIYYIEKTHNSINMDKVTKKNRTLMKLFDMLCAFIFMIFLYFVIPILAFGTLILNILSIIFIPVCHP